jgi:hypothetical protein
MIATKMSTRRQRTINHSYVEEAQLDLEEALAQISVAQKNDSVTALRAARTSTRLAYSRLNEAVERAQPPEGQATLQEAER